MDEKGDPDTGPVVDMDESSGVFTEGSLENSMPPPLPPVDLTPIPLPPEQDTIGPEPDPEPIEPDPPPDREPDDTRDPFEDRHGSEWGPPETEPVP